MNRNFIFLTFVIVTFSLPKNVNAAICKKELSTPITMDDEWSRKEGLRLANEEVLLRQYSKYISKESKSLIAEPYQCTKGEDCDPVKNCQMEKNVRDIREMEYSITTDSGIKIAKSYCGIIGKCIGYNEFFHSSKVTAAEDRLIDVKKDNAVFYHYFYSAHSKDYEPLFNITNFHTGSELYLNDVPSFSPDGKFMIEVRSIPKEDAKENFPTGYNINIYEINDDGEYINIETPEIDLNSTDKITSTFLSRNPSCGTTPHFHSWKNDREVRLSMLPPADANKGMRVILAYDKKLKKWGCKEDIFPELKCESYLPSSTKYSSNLAVEQISEGCE